MPCILSLRILNAHMHSFNVILYPKDIIKCNTSFCDVNVCQSIEFTQYWFEKNGVGLSLIRYVVCTLISVVRTSR